MSTKSRSSSATVNGYIKTVLMAAWAQGKPTAGSDLLTVYSERIANAVKSNVPTNYRLAVRMGIKRAVATLTSKI